MNIKDKLPDLTKHAPKVLSADKLFYAINTMKRCAAKSQEEREKELYESLKKKYEEG